MSETAQSKELTEFIKKPNYLIIEPSSTGRATLNKLLVTLGVPTKQIFKCENLSEGILLAKTNKTEIVLTNYRFGERTALELLPVHIELFPNRSVATFILLCEENSSSFSTEMAEHEIDSFFFKPFTLDSLKSNLLKALEAKLALTPLQKELEIVKENIYLKKYPLALEHIKNAKLLDSTNALPYYLESKIQIEENQFDQAENSLMQGLEANPKHYLSLEMIFRLQLRQKKLVEAAQFAKTIMLSFPFPPKLIPDLIRIILFTKNFEDILFLHEAYTKIKNPDESLRTTLAAALTLAGKFIMATDKEKGLSILLNAITLAVGRPKIMTPIVSILYKAGFVMEAETHFKKLWDETPNSPELLFLELEVRGEKMKDADALKIALDLLKLNQKHPLIFETAIKKSILLKRQPLAIEELVNQAITTFPEQKDHYEALLKQIVP